MDGPALALLLVFYPTIYLSPLFLCLVTPTACLFHLSGYTHILTDKLRVDIFIKFIAISNYLYIYKIRFVSLEAIQSEKRICWTVCLCYSYNFRPFRTRRKWIGCIWETVKRRAIYMYSFWLKKSHGRNLPRLPSEKKRKINKKHSTRINCSKLTLQ